MYRLIWPILRLITGKQRIKLTQRLRNDSSGGGWFGASRGGRTHNGIDIVATPGEAIYAPIDMYVERTAMADSASGTGGIRFVPRVPGNGTHGYIFYMEPHIKGVRYVGTREPIEKAVLEGELIGYAQNVAEYYGGSMQPHIHIEQWEVDTPINIESSYI